MISSSNHFKDSDFDSDFKSFSNRDFDCNFKYPQLFYPKPVVAINMLFTGLHVFTDRRTAAVSGL